MSRRVNVGGRQGRGNPPALPTPPTDVDRLLAELLVAILGLLALSVPDWLDLLR